MKDKFGCEYAMQSDELKEKSKNAVKEKYGVDNIMQLDETKKKAQNTMIEKYGVAHAAQSQEIKDKTIQTNLIKFGTEWGFQNEQVKEKMKQTCLQKYGTEYACQNEEVIAKQRKTYQENHGIKDPFSNKEIAQIIEQFRNIYQKEIQLSDIYSNNDYFIELIKVMHKTKNRLLRLNEVASIFNVNPQTIKNIAIKLNLLDYFYIKDIDLEVQFKELLDQNGIAYERHNRNILYPQEIDFVLPKYKIGFEINDLETHNIMKKDENYHLNKTIGAEEKGYRLIHIWEWELTDDVLWNRLSNWIINIANIQKTKIFARKCDIKIVDSNEEKIFINNNHLQGYQKSDICLGLYYNNELVQLMSFGKPRYAQKNFEYELIRLCTKYGCFVLGGAEKLFKYFIEKNNPNSIISYCNLDKFDGSVYVKLGFKLMKHNQPSATWYNPEDGKRFSHSSLLKLGADKLIGTNFGKGTDNEEIAYRSGYIKVFNCGLNVYSYIKNKQ